jgi:putative membrane protein
MNAYRDANSSADEGLPSRSGLWFLLVFESLSLAGFATLGLHPEWLVAWPSIVAYRGSAFAGVAQAQLYLSAALLVVFLSGKVRAAWIPAAALVFGASLGVEYLGATTGIPFGAYTYSDLLGYSIGDRVPLVVPIAWLTMGMASYLVSASFLPRAFWPRQMVTALLLLEWDLVLDPAMSHVTSYWQWHSDGIYYGVPWLNFLGWLLTGLVVSLILEWTLPGQLRSSRNEWIYCYYVVNFLLPWGMILAGGLWYACLATATMLIGFYGLATRGSTAAFRFFPTRYTSGQESTSDRWPTAAKPATAVQEVPV